MRPHLVTALLLTSWSQALAGPDAGTPFTVDASHRVRAAPLPDGAWVRLVKDTSTLAVSGPGGRKDTLTLELPRFTAIDPRAQGVDALNQALEAACLSGTSRQGLLDELSRNGHAGLTGCSFTVGLVRGPVVSVAVHSETRGASPSTNRAVVLWSLATGAPFSLDAALDPARKKAFLDLCTTALTEARARAARSVEPKEWAELSRALDGTFPGHFSGGCRWEWLERGRNGAELTATGDLRLFMDLTHAAQATAFDFTIPAKALEPLIDAKGPLGAGP